MKIAWVTPTDEKSAIFEYSRIVVNELVKYAKVTTFGTTQSAKGLASNYHPLNDNKIIQKLHNFDLVIYNMGDHQPYHQKIFEVYLKLPGLMILHDLYYRNFFNGYFTELPNGSKLLKKLSEYTKNYSLNRVSSSIAFDFFGSNSYTNGLLEPLFEPVVCNALGIITHCKTSKNLLSELFPIPSESINLPYKYVEINSKFYTSNIVEITTLGRVNKEKRHDLVIKALSLDKSFKKKVHYNIVGLYDKKGVYFNDLIETVNKHGLSETVTFHGEISTKQMRDIFSKTNIFTNLRRPCLNTGSWSLIEELAYGKAVITNDFGYAKNIPNDSIVKLENVRNDYEEKHLLSVIKKLASSSSIRKKYEKNAIKYIKENNSPENYCKKLMVFAKKVTSNKLAKYHQEMSSVSATYGSLVFTNSRSFRSFFNFSGIIEK